MFKVCFEEDFDYSKVSRNLYSTFYVDLDGVNFPDNQWTDFPISVLLMWCENLLSDQNSFTLFFMDGPYCIECQRVSDNVHIQLIENRTIKKILKNKTICFKDLKSGILKASTDLITSVNQKIVGKVDDMEKLERLIKKLNPD